MPCMHTLHAFCSLCICVYLQVLHAYVLPPSPHPYPQLHYFWWLVSCRGGRIRTLAQKYHSRVITFICRRPVFFSFRTMTCHWPQAECTSDLSRSGKREGKQLCWTRRVFLCHQLIRQTSDIMEKAAKIAENCLTSAGQPCVSAVWDIFKLYHPAQPPPHHLPPHPTPLPSRPDPVSRSSPSCHCLVEAAPRGSAVGWRCLKFGISVAWFPDLECGRQERSGLSSGMLFASDPPPPFFSLSFMAPLDPCLLLGLGGTYVQGSCAHSSFRLFLWAVFVNLKMRLSEQIMKHRSAFHTLFRKNSPSEGEMSHFPPFLPLLSVTTGLLLFFFNRNMKVFQSSAGHTYCWRSLNIYFSWFPSGSDSGSSSPNRRLNWNIAGKHGKETAFEAP